MITRKKTEAARENIKKAKKAGQAMSAYEHSIVQSEGKNRKKPGEAQMGDYYRIVVLPKKEFATFRYHDVGERGGDLLRLAGKRKNGSWDTQAWLINKKSAHIESGKLVADTKDVQNLLDKFDQDPKHVKGDIWKV